MKKKFFYAIIAFAALFVSMSIIASASESNHIKDNVYYMANADDSSTTIKPQTVGESDYYLFLPSSADLNNLVLYFDDNFKEIKISADKTADIESGKAFDLIALFNDGEASKDEYKIIISAKTQTDIFSSVDITVMKSANVRSMYLVSDDAEKEGRDWVETSKSNEATGLVALISTDGKVDYSNKLTQLKCRGNSTFTDFTKKAYQIKINKKADLIGNNDDEANKKWVLLANAADMTLIHNELVFSMAKDLNMPFTPNFEALDLYYDGEYRGSYLLTEKTEVGGSARIDIDDLDGRIEDANGDNDAYDNPVIVTKTTASKGETDAKANEKGSYKYVSGLTEPELPKDANHQAYLLELEFISRYPDEMTGFVTTRGQSVLTSNPEYLTKDTGAYISQFWQDFENAVYSKDGYNTETGKYYYEYCDLDSLVKQYLINEISKNYDSYRSSTYFYLPADKDIMFAGPVWDYDLSFGNDGTQLNGLRQAMGTPENFFATTKYLCSALIKIQSFRDAVKSSLNSTDGEFYTTAMKLLGDDGFISKYSSEIYASQKMNYTVWDITNPIITTHFCNDEPTYDNTIKYLSFYIEKRLTWLSATTSEWNEDDYQVPTDLSYKGTPIEKSYKYHNNIIADPAVAPTCTETGLTAGSHCADCGTVYKKQNVVAALGHTWIEATCTTPKTCSVCGATEGEPSDQHNYVIDETDSRNSETCTVYKCTVCGETYLKYAGEVPHEHNWIEATCTEPKTCSICGATEGEALGHTWIEATCTEPKTCSICGATEGEALGHAWVEATCTSPKFCPICGETEGKALGHVWVDATCTTPKTCSVCGETQGEPFGHYYVEDPDDERNSDTCKVYKCSICGKEMLKEIEPVKILLGDMNLDGKITAADARLALRLSVSLDEMNDDLLKHGDMNGDGKLTSSDARTILRKSVGIE